MIKLVCSYCGKNPSFVGIDCSTKVERARPSELRPSGTAVIRDIARIRPSQAAGTAICQAMSFATRLEF